MIALAIVDGFAQLVATCDTCGDRIRDGAKAVVTWDTETDESRVSHKGRPCDSGLDQWEDLDCALGYLLVALRLEDVVAAARDHGWRDPDSFRRAA